MIIYILFAIIICLLYWWYNKTPRNIVPQHVETLVSEVLRIAESEDITVKDAVEHARGAGRLPRVTFTASLVNEARAHFGSLRMIESNRLMVRKFMRDKCVDHGVRVSHIAQHLDSAVAIFFIPTESDILCKQVRQSQMSVRRAEEMRTSWYSRFTGIASRLTDQEE